VEDDSFDILAVAVEDFEGLVESLSAVDDDGDV